MQFVLMTRAASDKLNLVEIVKLISPLYAFAAGA